MKAKRGSWSILVLGLLLMAAGVSLVVYNKWESDQAGEQSDQALTVLMGETAELEAALRALERQEKVAEPSVTEAPYTAYTPRPMQSGFETEIEIPDYILNPHMDMPTREANGYAYIAVLYVPALDLTLPIMDRWDYGRLKISPCRYAGSAYTNDLVIAGHAYEKHFWPLRQLKLGDDVFLTDMDGNAFRYSVAEIMRIKDTSITEMVSSDYDLTLFTCTRDGTPSRLAVRCDRYADPNEFR